MRGCVTAIIAGSVGLAIGTIGIASTVGAARNLVAPRTTQAAVVTVTPYTLVDPQTPIPTPGGSPAATDAPVGQAPATVVVAVAPQPLAASAVVTQTWSGADCTWATTTLQTDSALDLAAQTDPRFKDNPADVAIYVQAVDYWNTALTQVQSVCTKQGTVTAADLDASIGHFDAAQADHLRRNGGVTPATGDYQWNALWAGNYARLTALFNQVRP